MLPLSFRIRCSRYPGASRLAGVCSVWTIAFSTWLPGSAHAENRPSSVGEALLVASESAHNGSPISYDACSSCHQDKVQTYQRTAHSRTSALPSLESIHGQFLPGSNLIRTTNRNLLFVMEATDRGFFQKAVMRTSPSEAMERAERFDVVVGSGRKGQSYLFWDADTLFQLPISYWSELKAWVNSPGYLDGTANFERPIAPRCLECHTSSFESRAPPENRYNPATLVPGISCEKCHGDSREHVRRYRSASPPTSRLESALINPAHLPRDRQIDGCALCHAGIGNAVTPPLSYTAGDVLANHLQFPKLDPSAHLDVHGSQVQLLEKSRCFQASATMSCATCHDVHATQRDVTAFAAKCAACHQVETCLTFPKLGHAIDQQCVTCHMPLQETAQIVSAANGRSLQPRVRNHQIAIYPGMHLP